MKTRHYIPYILLLFILIIYNGCMKEEKINTVAQVRLVMPADYENINLEGVEVKLYSTTSGLSYTSRCDQSGIASFHVEYGFYEAVAQHRLKEDNNIDIFNGRLERIVLTKNTDESMVYPISMSHARLQQLIIKEIYYASCKRNDGTNYTGGRDTYVSIYNNSDEIAYLDSLCIGAANPATSASKSNFTKPDGSLWDEIPLFLMAWQIPGGGTDYPLLPGEESIVALNAIDHTIEVSNSVNLSNANFAFWNTILTGASVPAPNVTPLNMIWRLQGTAYSISTTGPAMVIFRIPQDAAGSASEYAANPDNIIQDPVNPGAQRFLMIHKDWVIDGVECISSPSANNKRLPNSIDAGYTYIPTSNLGNSVCRKIEELIEGRIVYADTNNSSEDFEVIPNTFKSRE